MDDLTDIFESEIQGRDSADTLDIEVAAAGLLLSKFASEDGIDLDSLPPEAVADLLVQIHGNSEEAGAEPNSSQHPTKEASAMSDTIASAQTEEVPVITHADVALELSKRAAANHVDLAAFSTEEYTEVFDKVAAEMLAAQTPEGREQLEKVAEARQIGAIMAEGFIEAVNAAFPADKTAGDLPPFMKKEDDDSDDDKKDKKDNKKEEEKKAGVIGRSAERLGRGAVDAASKVTRGRAEKVIHGAASRASEGIPGGYSDARKRLERRVGGALAGGGAAVAAGGAGAAALGHHRREKNSSDIEAEAIKVARQALLDNNIDPDTGGLIEEKTAEDFEAAVEARAEELLTEKGWL